MIIYDYTFGYNMIIHVSKSKPITLCIMDDVRHFAIFCNTSYFLHVVFGDLWYIPVLDVITIHTY